MDKNMLGDLDNLPEEDKMRMAVMVDQLQVRDRSTPRPPLIVPLLDPYLVLKPACPRSYFDSLRSEFVSRYSKCSD
jgi:hypothetical protein